MIFSGFPLPEVRVLGFKGAALSDHFGRPMHKTRDGGNVSQIRLDLRLQPTAMLRACARSSSLKTFTVFRTSSVHRSTFTLCTGYRPYSTPAQCLCLSLFLLVETSTFNVQRSLFASDLDNIVRRANACASL